MMHGARRLGLGIPMLHLVDVAYMIGDCPFGILDNGAGLEESGSVHWYLALYDWHEFT